MVAEVIVSHGYFVDETNRALGGTIEGWGFYCAVSNYKISQTQELCGVDMTLLHGSKSDHIVTRA